MRKKTTRENVSERILDDDMMRWGLTWSNAFNSPPFEYHMDDYKAAIRESGGMNVREAYQFGWSNQPKVATWTGNRAINKAIKASLYRLPPFSAGVSGLPAPIIQPHWR